jgi:Xaa-Pro dipeptidase
MSREEVDGTLFFNPFNIRYLTGYKPVGVWGSSVAVLSQDREPRLIVPQGEYEQARANSWFRTIQAYRSHGPESTGNTLFNRLKEAVEQLKLQSVDFGVELNYIPAIRFEELKRLLPDAGFKNITSALTDLRMIKDEAEIEKIQTATQIAENGVRAAIEFIQPNISEIEVAAEVERTIRRAGATGTGFPTVITSGPRARYGYTPASRHEISPFEPVIISVSAVFDDYCSNITRTVMTGKPTKEFVSFFDCARDAVVKTQSQLTSETLVRDVALNIRRIAENYELLPNLFDFMGYSIGLEPIEPPFMVVTDEKPLRPGMVFTIEAGLFKPDLGGICLSNTIVYHRTGTFQVLNQIPLETI